MMLDVQKIEDKLDKVAAGSIEISQDVGGIKFESMMQVMEFAKMVSISGHAVPKHLRGEPGACLGIVIQSLEWRFSPYFVANKSYLVNDRLAYEAGLMHAVILTRAPIKNQEAHVEYTGEGDERQCRVWVELVSGSVKDYTTPKIGKITPQNSPLWKNDPDQQLFYYASRSLARRHFPHVLGGVYSKDEIEDNLDNQGPDKARDVTPKPAIGDRLKGAKGRGFDAKHVETQTAQAVNGSAGDQTKADPETGEIQEEETKDFAAADAMKMGREAFRQKRSNRPPEEWRDGKNEPFADAFKAGYDDEEASQKKPTPQRQETAAMKDAT